MYISKLASSPLQDTTKSTGYQGYLLLSFIYLSHYRILEARVNPGLLFLAI